MFDKINRHTVWQNSPAIGLHDRWRDATPLGNGLTGMLQYGGVSADEWIVSRYDLWFRGYEPKEIPDVSDSLIEMRRLIDDGKFAESCEIMCKTLQERGYGTGQCEMRPVAGVIFKCDCPGVYSDYRRAIHMNTGEADIEYLLDGEPYSRRSFVSRKRDIIVGQYKTPKPESFTFSPRFHVGDDKQATDSARKDDLAALECGTDGDCCLYSTRNNDGTYFGLVCRVISDGAVTVTDTSITVDGATKSLLLVKAFSEEKSRKSALRKAVRALSGVPADYDVLFREHSVIHKRLYNSADLRLYAGRTFHSNEELLAESVKDELTSELSEKLWRFGRYLFISGINSKGTPFPLYGLWAADYLLPWSQNVGNENVEIIHWHATVGGLTELILPLINYYYGKMDVFREAARKLFGVRGIFASTYTTPRNSAPSPCVPVIINFNGTAGWLCRHFYDYYLMTGDENTLNEKILPFMLEAAQYYEDYVLYDRNGKITIYPSVSPENSPHEYHDIEHVTASGHTMPITKDATIEIAIMKDLLRHLLELSKTHDLPPDRVKNWKKMLSAAPDYRINDDGAIAEWIYPEHLDEYEHRHLSHIYPAFPGEEILEERPELLPAFCKAVKLRKLGYLTGWSLAHSASICARLGDGKSAFDYLNKMVKVCLLPNFFTMHNDYRGMGITTDRMGDASFAPVQLDALLGSVNTIQEMLLTVTPKKVILLPSITEKFNKGEFSDFRFFGGRISLKWNAELKEYAVRIVAERDCEIDLTLPFGDGEKRLKLHRGESSIFKNS